MSKLRLYNKPAYIVRQMLIDREIEPEDYVEEVFERIERHEPRINSFITLRPKEDILREVKIRVKEAQRSPTRYKLAGILVAIKDNIHVENLPVTCGSMMLKNYIAPYNATVIERLAREGAVIIGKTNMDEFAMGSTGENSAFGPTRNPWDLSRVPGGSSSGSAAALAAGFATIALGSDTGGSIRLPSAWTGIYGLKPTYGTVSRYGLVAYADSLEQIGPMARNIMDLVTVFNIIRGFDGRDSTMLKKVKSECIEAKEESVVDGLKVAVVEDFFEIRESIDERILNIIRYIADVLDDYKVKVVYRRLGRDIIEYSLPSYYVIAMSEASSNLARYDGVRFGPREELKEWTSWTKHYSEVRRKFFGLEVKLRIMLGSWMLSSGYRDQYYVKALKLRRLVRDKLVKLLNGVDAILLPSCVLPPPRLGEVIDDPIKLYMLDIATVLANISGLPAINIPSHFVEGIPLGVQFIAKYLDEHILFRIGALLEEETKIKNRVSPIQ